MAAPPEKYARAIAAMLETTTIRAAAQRGHINERTLRRWTHDPVFQAQYREARRELIKGAIHTLLHHTASATDTLVAIMQDPEAPATARVSAARAILGFVLRSLSEDDTEERLVEIERQLAQRNGHHG
jgi:hypothetical protein